MLSGTCILQVPYFYKYPMLKTIKIWLQNNYFRIINSIAFYPAFIGFLFLIGSSLIISFDFSEWGKELKSELPWLVLKDASTARSIISAISAGIISLTVFSFSMVMIVLNQAASQMSNRVLNKLIGNRFQQIVLGIYIGTIVYAFFLMTTIRDIDSGIYIPSISTYLLILLTIFDIFLFIYFLHYITQSVKYEVIVRRIYVQTKNELKEACLLKREPNDIFQEVEKWHKIVANRSGVYEGFNQKTLLKLCQKHNCTIYLVHTPGTFVLEDTLLFKCNIPLEKEVEEEFLAAIYLHFDESIDANFFYGFRQLMEIAIKALSPGINDPGTAVISLRALAQLLSYRANRFPKNRIRNEEDQVLILIKEMTFEQIFSETILPIWDYGKEDRMIQKELHNVLNQLLTKQENPMVEELLNEVDNEMGKRYLL